MTGFLISKEFPSRFVNGDEVEGKVVPLVVKEVRKESVFSPKTQKKDTVLVVYFESHDRGVRLGKERARELQTLLGDNTDSWKGKRISMYTDKRTAFGKTLNVIHFMDSQKSE